VSRIVSTDYVPVKVHVKDEGGTATFERFGIQWTPVLLVLDAKGKEQHRWEGYLPPDEFLAQLRLGLAKAAFGEGRWEEAARRFDDVAREHAGGELGALATYYAGVARYKGGDPQALPRTAEALRKRYAGSAWATKSSVWLPADAHP
jgi:hypothetical protein